MTAAVETPSTAVDVPEVAAVAGVLRQLWPEMPGLVADRHARTFVRVAERHYGPADCGIALRLSTVMAPANARPQLDPATKIDAGYGRFLVPWDAKLDCRPKTKTPRWLDPYWAPGGPGRGSHGHVGSARHGECTYCVRDQDELVEAIYRVTNDRGNTQASICAKCAKKMIGGPVVVPSFSSPEEAQAWLDANGD